MDRENPGYWRDLITEVNHLRKLLDDKPAQLKCWFARAPGPILNAYREGDVSFDDAVKHLTKWAETVKKLGTR